MSKEQLYHKIIEILVFSQFNAWVEPEDTDQTADEINTKSQRALDYYLGRTRNPKIITPWEQVRFNHIIKKQASLIMLEVVEDKDNG